jgi:HD-GYP domain-containing protein (c-di-GMP phosphodiesterase class II)
VPPRGRGVSLRVEPRDGKMREQDLVLSGGRGVPTTPTTSTRAGYIPIALQHLPLNALRGIGVYIRFNAGMRFTTAPAVMQDGYCLYCTERTSFTEHHRKTLMGHGVRFAYIRMVDHARFREQNENCVVSMANDPKVAVSKTSAMIYETSVELMNELMADPEVLASSPRLEQVSRAVTTVVIKNPTAFSHLFAASHHDFYTATHMVNVGTWMVPLAFEMGITDPEQLNLICQAGMLHDMGKTAIPPEILNKQGKLAEEEMDLLRGHPEAGYRYLSSVGGIPEIVRRVALEHHERIDGSGYPYRIKGRDMHPASRICAVVDSFDAMTAFRPFKKKTLSIAEAMDILQSETPHRYDREVVDAWSRLINNATKSTPGPQATPGDLRRHERTTFHCPGRLHRLEIGAGAKERAPISITAHNISRGGLGLLARRAVNPGELVRVYLHSPGWEDRGFTAEVVRCRRYDDRWHEVGVRFVETAADNRRVA